MPIEILSSAQIERMRRAGRAAAETLAFVGARLKPGMSTADIDRLVREDTARRGGKPSQLGYMGFPAAVCTSRNEVVCHGIPSKREILRSGDIVNVDVTTNLDGYHGDTSATFLIGEVSADARRIVDGSSLDMPRIVPVRASSIFRGDGWMGVKMRDASVVKGVGVLPMFAGLVGLLLLLGAFAATWLREGR